MDKNLGKPLFDYSAYVVDRSRDFSGRDWVLKAIDAWLSQSEGARCFVLTGEPGSGKTAIASWLALIESGSVSAPHDLHHLTPGFLKAIHFCSAQDLRWVDPRVFAESLSLQLKRSIPRFADILYDRNRDWSVNIQVTQTVHQVADGAVVTAFEQLDLSGLSAEEIFSRAVREPLEVLFKQEVKEQIIIMIDGLDETLVYPEAKSNIVRLIAQTAMLPKGVRFLLTTRPDTEIMDQLREIGIDECSLTSSSTSFQCLEDVQRYVQRILETKPQLIEKFTPDLSAAAFIDTVRRRSQGNFLYVYHLLRMLETQNEAISAQSLEQLPLGLDAIYRLFLRRAVGGDRKAWREQYATVLGTLAVAKEALSEALLAAFVKQPQFAVRQILTELRQLLETDDQQPASARTYNIYHRSFSSFLLNEDRAEQYWCEALYQHQRIIEFYRGQSQQMIQLEQFDEYGLRYVVRHLQDCLILAQTESAKNIFAGELYTVVLSPSFRQAQKERLVDKDLADGDLLKGVALAGGVSLELLRSSIPSDLVIRDAKQYTSFRMNERGFQLTSLTILILNRSATISTVLSDLWATLLIAVQRGDWKQALMCIGIYWEMNRRPRFLQRIFQSVDSGKVEEALDLAQYYKTAPGIGQGWAAVLYWYLAWEAAEAGQIASVRQAIVLAQSLPAGAPAEIGQALIARASSTLSRAADKPQDARSWLVDLGLGNVAEEILKNWKLTQSADPATLESLQTQAREVEDQLELITLEDQSSIPDMSMPIYLRSIGVPLYQVFVQVVAEPWGQAAVDRVLQKILTEPEPSYREIGLMALALVSVAAPEVSWARARLRQILQAILDWDLPHFSFDSLVTLIVEAHRRNLSDPIVEALTSYYDNLTIATIDSWGIAARAQSAYGRALFRQGEKERASYLLENAALLPLGRAPYAVLHLLSLASCWCEYDRLDKVESCIEEAVARAKLVRDIMTRQARMRLVETYQQWLKQGVPNVETIQTTWSQLSKTEVRVYEQYITARYAKNFRAADQASVMEILSMTLVKGLLGDGIMSLLLGVDIQKISNVELVELLRIAGEKFVESGLSYSSFTG